jgi:hypothetical protein
MIFGTVWRCVIYSTWVQIQKEVISDLKRESQFLAKEIWETTFMIDLQREICKNWILRRFGRIGNIFQGKEVCRFNHVGIEDLLLAC